MAKDKDFFDILLAIRDELGPVGAVHLSKRLGIPSASIGRMLSKMEADGLLEKMTNKGRCLTQKGREFLDEQNIRSLKLDTAGDLINVVENTTKKSLLEILQVRKLLESEAVELACKNATDQQLGELERIMLEYIYDIRRGGLGNEQDLALHLTIAELSGNSTIYMILNLILTKENAFTKLAEVTERLKNIQLMHHDAIVRAIIERNPKNARLAITKHLDQVSSDVMQFYHEMSP